MNNIDIDTEKLEDEKNKIVKTKKLFEELFDKIKNDTNSIKEYWSSDVSENVFASFEEFYKEYKECINNIDNDIAFLENVVNKSYEIADSDISKSVDENLN